MEEFIEKYLIHDNSSFLDKKMHEIEIQKLIDSLEISGPVLDMGFGHGVLTKALVERFSTCAVVEKSSALVAEANRLFGSRLEVHHSSFETFSPSSKFNTVFAAAVLHHVDNPLAVLRRVRSWLHPEGKVIVTVPNSESIHRAIAVATGLERDLSSISRTGKQMGVIRTFNSTQLEDLINRAGFFNAVQHPSFVKFLPYSEMVEFTESQLESLFALAELAPKKFHASIVFEASMTKSH